MTNEKLEKEGMGMGICTKTWESVVHMQMTGDGCRMGNETCLPRNGQGCKRCGEQMVCVRDGDGDN